MMGRNMININIYVYITNTNTYIDGLQRPT